MSNDLREPFLDIHPVGNVGLSDSEIHLVCGIIRRNVPVGDRYSDEYQKSMKELVDAVRLAKEILNGVNSSRQDCLGFKAL